MSVIRGANLAWQLGGDAQLLRELADGADGLALVECRTKDNRAIDVQAILGKHWKVWQDLSSPARAGSVIAIRKGSKLKRRWGGQMVRKLRRVASGGEKLQDRYLRSLPVKDETGPFELMVVHIPIAATGEQGVALARTRNLWTTQPGRKLIYTDGNAAPEKTARAIGAPNFDGDGVVVWCWSHSWKDIVVTWRTKRGSDHRVGTIKTWLAARSA